MKNTFFTFMLKDLLLARRNILIWLIIAFPIFTAFGASGITETYSDMPKIVVLKDTKQPVTIPAEIMVYEVSSYEDMKTKVRDLDTKIGFMNGKLITDGRESPESVKKAAAILDGKPIEAGKLSPTLFNKVYAFNLYGSFLFFGMILLFSLVEERKNKTIDLQHVQPAHPAIPVLAKLTVASIITLVDFVVCSFILNVPFNIVPILFIIIIGILLGTVLGLSMAFYASTETQALAILKPITFVFLISIPGLGLFLESDIVRIIAMFNPFYWFLQLIYSLYTNDLDLSYLYLSFTLCIIALLFIIVNWHRTPYGRKNSN
ncbi:ABC transporter permease [Bacillus sp. 1780r2a1]|uniref:ABC transporter permease n=1 Tax=Priestia TaxID=2800373 RepID=UPI00220AE7CA|nr:ABC transporter permease [Bacillus sp. 1780r2a1]